MKKSIEDKFGNEIKVGDYVFVSCTASRIGRFRVTGITQKGVYLDSRAWANIKSIAKDESHYIRYLEKRNEWLCCLEACGVDNWCQYDVAMDMFEGKLDET